MINNNYWFLAILITGGYRLKSVEIYLPSNNTICSLPELPKGRRKVDHTQDGPLACGGEGSWKTWDLWSQGHWTRQPFSLRKVRFNHVSWATSSGVYLMGGMVNGLNTELVKKDGTVEKGFPLKYDTE